MMHQQQQQQQQHTGGFGMPHQQPQAPHMGQMGGMGGMQGGMQGQGMGQHQQFSPPQFNQQQRSPQQPGGGSLL
jgi:hypothetical protein